MVRTCLARAKKKSFMRYLARRCRNMTEEDLRATMRLSEKALRELSLSEWLSVMKGLQPVQETILPSSYSIFRFEPLPTFYLGG